MTMLNDITSTLSQGMMIVALFYLVSLGPVVLVLGIQRLRQGGRRP